MVHGVVHGRTPRGGWSIEGVQGVVHGLGVSVFNSPVPRPQSDFSRMKEEAKRKVSL